MHAALAKVGASPLAAGLVRAEDCGWDLGFRVSGLGFRV